MTGEMIRMGGVLLLAVMLVPAVARADESKPSPGNGQALFAHHCAGCHGRSGKGLAGDWRQPLPGPGLKYPPPPLDHRAHAWHHADGQLQEIILEGGSDGRMPAFREKLTLAESRALVRFLHGLWQPEQRDWQRRASQRWPLR